MVDYQTFKLVSGAEIIAEVEREDETGFYLINTIEIIQTDNMVMLQKYSLVGETQDFYLNKKHVIINVPIKDDYKKKYVNFVKLSRQTDNEPVKSFLVESGTDTIN